LAINIKCNNERFYHTFCTNICTLTVLLYDTMMVVTAVIEVTEHIYKYTFVDLDIWLAVHHSITFLLLPT